MKRTALAKDVPSDLQVRLWKINVARRSHSRRQQAHTSTDRCLPSPGMSRRWNDMRQYRYLHGWSRFRLTHIRGLGAQKASTEWPHCSEQ